VYYIIDIICQESFVLIKNLQIAFMKGQYLILFYFLYIYCICIIYLCSYH